MRFPSGQPLWQNGTPHSMQRAPWAASSSSGRWTTNSWKSPTRSAGSRDVTPWRSIFRKPPSSPISRRSRRCGGGGTASLAVPGPHVRGAHDVDGLALELVGAGAVAVGHRDGLLGGELGEHALVVGREDLDE